MFNDPRNLVMVLLIGSAFGLVLSLWVGAVLFWTGRSRTRLDQIEQRIGLAEAPTAQGRVLRLWHEGSEATTIVPGRAPKNLFGHLECMLREAGWQVTVARVLLGVTAATLSTSLVAFLITARLLPSLAAGASVVILFRIYLKQRVARRTSLFEQQLVDALELAARSLRVGHPLAGAFRLISEELPAPMGPIFAAICQQQSLGAGLGEAVCHAAAGHESDDLKLFATAVVIQLRSGGSLADMMERLSFVIRDRMRLARRVRVLTAQTQFSKRVLQVLPVLVFVLLNVLNPDYMRPLYSTDGGRNIMFAAGACLLVGSWLMNRLAIIRY